MGNNASTQTSERTTAKYFEDQFDDEEVLFVFRKHPIVMRKGLIIASVATLVGPVYTLVLTYLRPLDPPSITFFFLSMVASFVLAAIIYLPSWISWHFSVYVVTDQRFIQITHKGFFTHSVVDMSLSQIQMVNYEIKGMNETLLGFGTIMMQTMVGDLIIHEVHHPAKIQKKILQILRTEGVPASGETITADSPVEQRLERDEDYEEAQ